MYIRMAKYSYDRWVLMFYFVWSDSQGCDHDGIAECIYEGYLFVVYKFSHFWAEVQMFSITNVLPVDKDVSPVSCLV